MTKKHPSSDAKMERLLNLVLALLGSKRFVTKSELLKVIPGYEGTSEARDRMFERDKDELRALGIDIEVQQLDALFDDEVGYRIRSDGYRSQLPKLSAEEGLVASAALSIIALLRDDESVRKTQLKLDPLIDVQTTPLHRLLDRQGLVGMFSSPHFAILLKAIEEGRVIRFEYERDGDGERSERHLEPYKLFLSDEEWFLYGFDKVRGAERLFHLDNIIGVIDLRDARFSAPESMRSIQLIRPILGEQIICRAPDESGASLVLEGGEILAQNEGSIDVSFQTRNRDRLLRILLSIHPTIEILSPDDAVRAFDDCRERLLDAI